MSHSSRGPDTPKTSDVRLPIEVEIYVNPDGSVTFADLEAGTLPIVRELNPGESLVCGVKSQTEAEDDPNQAFEATS